MQWALHVSGPFTSLVLCAVWLCGAPGTALIMVSQSGTAAQTHSGHSLSSMRACHTHLALLMALRSGQTLVCGTQSLMTHQQMPIGSTLWSSDGGRLSRGMHGDWTNFNDSFIIIWTHAGVSYVWAEATSAHRAVVRTGPQIDVTNDILRVPARGFVPTAVCGKISRAITHMNMHPATSMPYSDSQT